jgi:hypothetical protein
MKVKHLIQELKKIKNKERDIQILIGDDDKDYHGSDDFTLMHTLDNDDQCVEIFINKNWIYEI